MLNQIFHADCFNIFPEIPDRTIDMVLCDLPYNLTQNSWDSLLPLDKLWKEYSRICKENAAIVLTASQPFTSILIMSNLKMFKDEWIWIKNRGSNFANTVRSPFKEHESVLMFSNGGWTYNKQMQERTGSGKERIKHKVSYRTESNNYRQFPDRLDNKLPELRVPSSWQKFNTETNRLHPTVKPVELFSYFIKTYSNANDTILDNCIGSGTTAIACIRENRNYIGIEKEEKYYKICMERINAELSKSNLS